VYDVKSTSQPDTKTLLGTNCSLPIIETGFEEQFYAFHRMGPALSDLYENLSVNSLKGDLMNATTFNPPLFSLVNTFKAG
jgi:hypothetical protein